MFQTRNICTIPVRALGSKLRAGMKPLQGEIVVDTNGGAVTMKVLADVPIMPFPKGVYANDSLAGAKSPQEIAKRSTKFPNEAAVLFETGAVKASSRVAIVNVFMDYLLPKLAHLVAQRFQLGANRATRFLGFGRDASVHGDGHWATSWD